MNKHVFLITAALAASLCGVGCNKSGKLNEPSKGTAPTGPVELKLKWTVGERVLQNIGMKINMEISGTNLPGAINQDMVLGEDYALNVLSADAAGGHELEMEFLGIRMTMDQGGKTLIDYDSAKKSSSGAGNPALAGVDKMFQNIVGAKIHFYLNPSNRVERVEGFDTLMNKMTAAGQAQAMDSMKSLFSEESLKQMIGGQNLPTKPVQPGDSWPMQTDIAMGNLGTMALDYTFNFARWETHGVRNCARLEFQGTMKTKGKPEAAGGVALSVQDGDSSGVAWFDPELGLVVETRMNQNMNVNMTVPMPGRKNATQGMTMVMKQDVTMKVESVK